MRRSAAGWAWLWLAACGGAQAGSVDVVVTGRDGALANAVVSLHRAGTTAPPERAQMDQRDLQFVPRVLAVSVGSEVRFPNSDNLRHQVYSFSPARTFELPLYSGTPAAPVVFDRAGVVELGCNIHDGMIGYIVVLDTPWHAVTGDDGRARFDLPAGDYEVRAWHEGLDPATPAPTATTVSVTEHGTVRTTLTLPASAPPAPVSRVDPRLLELQRRAREAGRGD